MNLKDEATWEQAKANNTDPYGYACILAAEHVMKMMDNDESIDANALMHEADDILDLGLSGFQAGAIASIVSQCHARGEEFRKSWNGEFGQEDAEGVVNPAILTIDTGEEQ